MCVSFAPQRRIHHSGASGTVLKFTTFCYGCQIRFALFRNYFFRFIAPSILNFEPCLVGFRPGASLCACCSRAPVCCFQFLAFQATRLDLRDVSSKEIFSKTGGVYRNPFHQAQEDTLPYPVSPVKFAFACLTITFCVACCCQRQTQTTSGAVQNS